MPNAPSMGVAPRVNVLGVGISAINLSQGADLVVRAVEQKHKRYIAVTNVHGVSEAQSDSKFREILNGAYLTAPDGMPMTWIGRLHGFKQMDRVYGQTSCWRCVGDPRTGASGTFCMEEKKGWQIAQDNSRTKVSRVMYLRHLHSAVPISDK
jgi:UDP-N-acetyl-D-mannosaminuronic acid transferase (WecB/TagA/CpsF family)